MRNVKVRAAKNFDLLIVERHYGGPLDTIGDPFCETSKLQGTKLDWLLVAEVDQKYAGFLYWHLGWKPFFAPTVESFAHIREVQVLEDFRGQGVGKKLVIHALSKLRKLSVQEVFLSTAETNHLARRMYEGLGFKEFRKQIQYNLRLSDWLAEPDQILTTKKKARSGNP